MSDAVIAFSAVVEPWLAAMVAVAALVLAAGTVRDRQRRSAARVPLDARIDRRTEALLLALVVVVAFVSRGFGWDDALTPPFWFSQVTTLHVDRMLHDGSLWATWTERFQTTQVGWAHESVFLLPPVAALQAWLGPRLGIPVLVGCLAGTLSVLLAWALGRRLESQAFGLAFAAFVAGSPLQLTWARLGPYYIAAVPHVLLALLVGIEAGRRGSIVLAALAGLVSWASLYHYYAARVAIPLTLIAVIAGAAGRTSMARRVLLIVVWAVALVGSGYLLAQGTVRSTLWPAYGGYAGNKGEQTIAEFVGRNLPGFIEEARLTPGHYFRRFRTREDLPGYSPGMQYGGLCLVPTALLGALGLLAVVRRLRRRWLWLVIAAAGLALPVASVMTARRILVFDLAWCAFAAYGLLAVVDGLGAGWSRRTRAIVAGLAVGLVAMWASTAVFALSAALPPASSQWIPFGEAGFGDGTTCKRCLEAAKGWQREITTGGFVVLFDSDQARENRTSPGGLPVYGKIVAAGAGKPESFAEIYALMANWDGEQPAPGVVFDTDRWTFATYLIDRIERAAPTRIVWHFERPSRWERWLAHRLAEVGGALASFPTALSRTPGVRVVTPWERRAEAFDVLRELATGWRPPEDSSCVTLTRRKEFVMAGPVLVLAAAPGDGTTAPPEWLASSWAEVRLGPRRFEHPTTTTIGAAVRHAGTDRLELFGEFGRRTTVDLASGQQTVDAQPTGNPGFNCAVHADGYWWTVDPVAGHVASPHPNAAALTDGKWIGAARGPADELVLASADQALVVFDAKAGRLVRRIPARVSPSVRFGTDECSQIAAGDDWMATVDLRLGVASFYSREGRALGTKRIDPEKSGPEMLTAFAGAGRHLGTGTTTGIVRTFEVAIDPACVATPDAAAAAE